MNYLLSRLEEVLAKTLLGFVLSFFRVSLG